MKALGLFIGRAGKVLTSYFVLGFYYVLHFALIYVNYLAIKASFLLFNYDNSPLMHDQVSGWAFEAFGLDKVAQADVYALVIAVIMGFCTKNLFNEVYTAFRIYQDLEVYRDNNSFAAAKKTMVNKLVFSGLLMVPFFIVCAYEVYLFRSRFACWVLGLDGEEVSMTLPVWEVISQEYGGLFGIALVGLGAFAYLAIVCIISLLIERKAERKDEALVALREAYGLLCEELGMAPEALGNQPGQVAAPTYPLTAPLAAAAHTTTSEKPAALQPEIQAPPIPGQTDVEPVVWTEPVPAHAFGPLVSTEPAHGELVVKVYGGEPGETVSFAAALSDPDNYEIDGRRRVWKKDSASVPRSAEAA